MKERAYEAGIRPVDVLLTSAKKSHEDRKSVVQGKSVDLGGRRIIKKKKKRKK